MPEQIPTFWFMTASILFLLKHLLADFVLQTGRMAAGKEAEVDWLRPLLAHAAVHGAMTSALFLAFAPALAWLGAVDFVVHAAIDRAKGNIARRNGLTHRMPRFWLLLGIDQTLHHLTHLVFAVLLAASASAA